MGPHPIHIIYSVREREEELEEKMIEGKERDRERKEASWSGAE